MPDRFQLPAFQPAFGQSQLSPFVHGEVTRLQLSLARGHRQLRIHRRQRLQPTPENGNNALRGGCLLPETGQELPGESGQIHRDNEQERMATPGERGGHPGQWAGVGRGIEHDLGRVGRGEGFGTVGMLGHEEVAGAGFVEQPQLSMEEWLVPDTEVGFGESHASALSAGQNRPGEWP
jgi:hypothetical protein